MAVYNLREETYLYIRADEFISSIVYRISIALQQNSLFIKKLLKSLFNNKRTPYAYCYIIQVSVRF